MVGDESSLRAGVREAFAGESIRIEQGESASEALRLLRTHGSDIILSDVVMPGLSGLHLLEAARRIDPTIGFILLAGMDRVADAIEALRRGADDYILKPFDADEVRHAVHRTLHHRHLARTCREQEARLEAAAGNAAAAQQERLFLDALLAIVNAVEVRDGYGGEHVERVTRSAVATARRMRLDSESLRNLSIAGLLHDIGKIGIPDHILQKPTRLTAEEDEVMRRHPVISASIVERSDFLRASAPTILHHHERWDGGGYPHGLTGERIPIESRILGVAEAYDAILTPRPYRGKRTRSEAISELQRCAGAQFDAEVVNAFIRSLGDSSNSDLHLWTASRS